MTSPFPQELQRYAPGAWRDWLLNGLEGAPLARRRQAHALAAQRTLLDLTPHPGQAWFPLVSPESVADRNRLPGVLAQVTVGGDGLPLPPDGALRVRRWVAGLVGERALSLSSTPPLCFQRVPPRWTVTGRSWELAAALALLTHLVQAAPRRPVVLSAALGTAGTKAELAAVRETATKQHIVALEAPEADSLLLSNGPEPAPLERWLPGNWRGLLTMCLSVSPSLAATEMWKAWRAGDRVAAERLVPIAHASDEPRVQAVALWVRGSAALHRGQAPAGLRDLEQARALLQEHESDKLFQVEELDASLGIALLDGLDAEAAHALLQSDLDALDSVPTTFQRERWREVTLQVAGSLRRTLIAVGRPDDAVVVQRNWSLDRALLPTERARSLVDLGDSLLRAVDREAAGQALQQAEATLPDTPATARPMTARFLRIQRVRAGLEPPPDDWAYNAPDFHAFPQPLELAEWLLQADPEAVEAHLQRWPTDASPVELWVSSRLAALLVERHGLLPWCRQVVEALRPHVRDTKLGPAAETALEVVLEGKGQAWALRVAY